jgi:hypothetical protein
MIVTVHNLAKNYKLLPSEVLERGTTFDLYVLDTATRYIKYQQELAEGRAVKPEHKLSQQEMLDMIKRARSGK